MKLSDIAVARPVTTTMLFAALVLLGVVSIYRLPIQLFPNITAPGGAVFAQSRENMSHEEFERKLIKPIEGEIFQLPNVKNLIVYNWGNRAFFFIEFEFGTNVKYRIVDIQERLDRFRRENFEPNALAIEVFPFESSAINVQFMDVVLKGPRNDPEFTALDTEKLRKKLQDIDGISQAELWGGKRRQVDVRILQSRLQEFQIPLYNVINTVRTYATEPVFLGDIQENNIRYFVRLDGQFQNTHEIENVMVKNDGGIAVRHLGDVQERYQERRWQRRIDGQPALGINLQKEALINPITLSNRTRGVLAKINQELPPGYQLVITWDQAKDIKQLLKTLVQLALAGVVLSMLVLYLFIRNVKMTAIICLVIPISVITTFNAMYFSGLTLNVISLLGLAVGVGSLIDNSIVVLENIYRHHQHGRSAVQSARLGSREVGVAVFAFTLTNVVVFLPILFVDGMIRLIFIEGALAIVFPMLISMLVALTFVPMACSRMFQWLDLRASLHPRAASASRGGARSPAAFLHRWLPPWLLHLRPSMHGLRRGYAVVLKSCLRHRIRFLLMILIAVLYTGYYTAAQVSRDTIDEPASDDSFMIYVYLPPGTKQSATLRTVEAVEDLLLRDVDEAERIHAWVREDEAQLRVELLDTAQRRRRLDTIREELRPRLMEFSQAEVTYNRSPTRGEETAPLVDTGRSGIIEIRGPEYKPINTIADHFGQVLRQLPEIRDVINDTVSGAYELHFQLNKADSEDLQITARSVAQSIQVAQRQSDFSTIQLKRGDREVDIIFSQYQEPEALKNSLENQTALAIEELKELPIYSPILGGTLPLSSLGTFTLKPGMGVVQRENRERIGRLRFETAPHTNFQELEETIRELITVYPLPPGYRLHLGGKSEQLNEEWQAFKLIAGLAVLLIYMCIASLFESYSKPLVVMMAIPLASVGVIWAFLLTDTVFNPLSVLGIVFLMGILPNSAILLVHYATYLRREKSYSRVRAVFTASQTRLRPILMTVLTTVLGMLPMAIRWRGDDDWVPFAIPVIGGLLAATVMSLIIVPGFYFIVEDIAEGLRRVANWGLGVINPMNWRRIHKRPVEAPTAFQNIPLELNAHHVTRIYALSPGEAFISRFAKFTPPRFKPQVKSRASAGPQKAIQDLTLHAQAGIFGLLGPNGAGKTTLLRIIAGIDQPTRGTVELCGYNMNTEAQHARKHIGYLPQHFGVYSRLTAYHYLDYMALLKGMKNKSERQTAIMKALDMVNLTAAKNVPVDQFSGGMVRRIGLAQIFLQPPNVLIVDEPTVGLDPIERVRFRNLLSRLGQERIVLLSTHIVEDVAHNCQALALMVNGTVCYSGPLHQLLTVVKDKVWELALHSEQDWQDIRQTYRNARQIYMPDGIRMRIVADHPPSSNAIPIQPVLEDVYLYLTQTRFSS